MDKKITTRAKIPNKMLDSKINGTLDKGFYDIRDIVLAIINNGEDDEENLDYEIVIADYKDKLGLKFDHSAYKKLHDSVNRQLLKKTGFFKMYDEDGNEIVYSPFQEIVWKSNSFHVVLTRRFKQMLLGMKGNTFYNIENTLPMKSKYSKIMYPRLMRHISQPKIFFNAKGTLKGRSFTFFETIEDFRSVAGIPNSYQLNNVKDICKKIVNEIREYTDFTAEVFYNEARVSSSYRPVTTHIAWNLKKKAADKVIEDAEWQIDTDDPKEVEGQITLDELNMMDKVAGLTGLDSKSCLIIVKASKSHNVDEAGMLETCRYALNQNCDNLGAYITGILNTGGLAQVKDNKKKTSFNNFQQREYDFAALDKKLYSNMR